MVFDSLPVKTAKEKSVWGTHFRAGSPSERGPSPLMGPSLSPREFPARTAISLVKNRPPSTRIKGGKWNKSRVSPHTSSEQRFLKLKATETY